jgi:hypothetical protein
MNDDSTIDTGVRMGFLYSGISYQYAHMQPGGLFEHVTPIPIASLNTMTLTRFDALLVPRSTDMEILYHRRHLIRRFLYEGGVLVAFGEAWKNWLPGATWEPECLEDTKFPVIASAHPLVAGFTPSDLFWHVDIDKWCCHGHFHAPNGAEVIVTNARGDAWMYIDRVTTPGVILACSNLDADCHATLNRRGQARARDFLSRVLDWAREEAQAMRETKRHLPRRVIAALYSGIHFQGAVYQDPQYSGHFDQVPVHEFPDLDLSRYRVLWVPRETNQEMLRNSRDKIVAFLAAGGTLVSFEEANVPWLPVGEWQAKPVDIEHIVLEQPDHHLFHGFTVDELKWHAHGALRAPLQAQVLLRDAEGAALVFVDEKSFSGRILAMTLDPECHVGFGSDRPRRFLSRIIDWAVSVPAAV